MSDSHGHAAHDDHGSTGHIAPISLYIGVFSALLFGTALTIWVAYIDLGSMNTPVALTIAFVKAGLVTAFFMHLYWSERLTALFILSTLFFLLVLIAFVVSDVFTRNGLQFPIA